MLFSYSRFFHELALVSPHKIFANFSAMYGTIFTYSPHPTIFSQISNQKSCDTTPLPVLELNLEYPTFEYEMGKAWGQPTHFLSLVRTPFSNM